MGKGGVEKLGVKKQSLAMSAMGVEAAESDGCRTSLSLTNKGTIQADLIGINVEDIESSKLVSGVSYDSEADSIISDCDGKQPVVAPRKLKPYTVVVSLGLPRNKSNGTSLFLTRCVFPLYVTATKHGGVDG
jgi:hypothetical protein